MEQLAINFNYPAPGELFHYGTQDYILYERLMAGGITNVEMVDELRIFAYTRRICDIKEALFKFNLGIKKERVRGKVYLYKLVKLNEMVGAAA